MIHGLQFSLIQHIETNVPELTGVHWMYTGMPKPKISAIPYSTVEFMIDAIEKVSKDLTVQSDIRFQVGLVATDADQHLRIVSKMKRLLLFVPAVLYDTTGAEPIPVGKITFEVENVTSFGTDEIDEMGNYNRTYFDVIASITYNN